MTVSHTVLPNGQARALDRPALGRLLDPLDDYLRFRLGICEYSQSPDCLFRVELIRSSLDVTLSDGSRVRRGDRLINLHIWNEQFPVFPRRGPTVAWARRVGLCFDRSLRDLHDYLAARPDFDDVAAVCANMGLCSAARAAQLGRIVGHFGFEPVAAMPRPGLPERIHRFGENILIALTVLARNPRAWRTDTLWRDRMLVFLSRSTLRGRFGPARGSSACTVPGEGCDSAARSRSGH